MKEILELMFNKKFQAQKDIEELNSIDTFHDSYEGHKDEGFTQGQIHQLKHKVNEIDRYIEMIINNN